MKLQFQLVVICGPSPLLCAFGGSNTAALGASRSPTLLQCQAHWDQFRVQGVDWKTFWHWGELDSGLELLTILLKVEEPLKYHSSTLNNKERQTTIHPLTDHYRQLPWDKNKSTKLKRRVKLMFWFYVNVKPRVRVNVRGARVHNLPSVPRHIKLSSLSDSFQRTITQ